MIAVIGAAGQLGQEFCRLYGPARAVGLTHANIELTDFDSIVRALEPISPRVVINTAAFNHVDDAELRPIDALRTNAIAIRDLARFCQQHQIVLVHFSTDYVFGIDSTRSQPYSESDKPGPVNAYGISKLAGEYFVRSNCSDYFLIRTCGLYGLHGHGGKGRNFVQTMLRLGRAGHEVRVVDDQTCTPTAARDLAEATMRLLDTSVFGTYHWTNSGSCTWFQLACQIFEYAGLSVPCVPITSAQFGARAKRPTYSVLATTAYEHLGFPAPRPWQQAIREFVGQALA